MDQQISELQAPLSKTERKIKLLVIEDNVITRFSLEEMLDQIGIIADYATNAKEALSLYHSNYDLILMDIDLACVLDGVEITQIIRSIEEKNGFNNVPIIAITSHHEEPECQAQCFCAGMNGVLGKPNMQQLETLITGYSS